METNNNPNWLITKDLAKKLKEIGYKEECLFVFMPKDEKIGFTTERQRHYNFINGIDKNICDDNSVFYPAVTWTEVLEWFREENLIGTIEYENFDFDNETCYYGYRVTNKLGEIMFYSVNYSTYETYEEAREALIEKLIEIYTNKK